METLVLFVLLVLSLGGVWIFFDAARVRDAHAVGVGPGSLPPHRWAALTVLSLFVALRWYLAARARALGEPRRTGPPPRFESGGLQTFAFVVAATGLGVFVACLAFGEARASVLGLLVIALGWFGGREVRDTGRAESFELPQSAGWEQIGFVAPEHEIDDDDDEPLLDLDQVAARRRQAGPTGLPTVAPRTPPRQSPSPAPQPRAAHPPGEPAPRQPAPQRPPAQAPPTRQQPPPPPATAPPPGDRPAGALGDDVVDLHSLLGSSGPPPASAAPPSPATAASPATTTPATTASPAIDPATTAATRPPPPPRSHRPPAPPVAAQPPPPPTVARTDGVEFALDDRAAERTVRGPAPGARRPEPRPPQPPRTPRRPTPSGPTPSGPAQPRARKPATPTAHAKPTDGPIPLAAPPTQPVGGAAYAASARRGVPIAALIAAFALLAAVGTALGWIFWPHGDDPSPAPAVDGRADTTGVEASGGATPTAPSPAPTPIDEALASAGELLADDLRASMTAWAADYRRLFDPVADRIEAVDFDGFEDPSCYALRDALGAARSDLPDAADESIRESIGEALIAFDRAAAACLERDVDGWSRHVLDGKTASHAAQALLSERYDEDGLLDLELESASGDTRSRSSMTGRYLAQQELDF